MPLEKFHDRTICVLPEILHPELGCALGPLLLNLVAKNEGDLIVLGFEVMFDAPDGFENVPGVRITCPNVFLLEVLNMRRLLSLYALATFLEELE